MKHRLLLALAILALCAIPALAADTNSSQTVVSASSAPILQPDFFNPAPVNDGLMGPCTITVNCPCSCGGTTPVSCSGLHSCVGGGGVSCDGGPFHSCTSACSVYCSGGA